MKSYHTSVLLFLSLTLYATIAKAQLYDSSRIWNTQWGVRSAREDVFFKQETLTAPSNWNHWAKEDRQFFYEAPRLMFITRIEVKDLTRNGHSRFRIRNGGVDQQFVSMDFESTGGFGFSYVVTIYGRAYCG